MRWIFVLIIIFACSQHPQKGDIYENKLNNERVEVEDLGKCIELYRFQEARNTDADTSLSYSKERKIARGRIRPISPIWSDSSATCVGYLKEEMYPGYEVKATYYYIRERASFLDGHRLIN